MKKILFFWKELGATFWFLPVLIIGFSILLSFLLVYVDSFITIPREGWTRFFLVESPDSARSILSTISSAMMGVAGTVFSITLVVLTLASSQFGPRLIKNFMYVRLNQVVLGLYISTFLYCLLVLNSITDSDGFTFIPSLSILVAIFVTIINIVLLIIFIHRIAVSIQADKVVSDISEYMFEQAETLFPEKLGEEEVNEDHVSASSAVSGYLKQAPVISPKSGYLQYVDGEALIQTLSRQDALVELYYRPGKHIVEGEEIGLLFSNGVWEKKDFDKIFKPFVIGNTKTSQQDLEFSIQQLVEIAARALSTGVNDPYTAMVCIDNLTSIMCYLAQAKFPSKYRFDDEGNLRIIADTFNFEGVLDSAFNQIRQFSGGSPAVIIRMMEALTIINEFTIKESHKRAVLKHVVMVLSSGKDNFEEKNDLNDLSDKAVKIFKK
ncbi:DUF2254 domain-containing protein [Rhodohalobacter sp. SW132]|uniref:DUF2254 domain-containing protein n=1 Tax=Rhodohalobacter sp. SW132 TaxID=2293433 RepID=UPI000E229C9A|nr:DUF2254 domain-containing protein [Rhodohalobacter sp. SW132]REL37943.1 DUF2254 domain-containing protein [Rhodohalobacter sp. SW132]